MINFRFITNIMGRLLLLESVFLFACVVISLIYRENDGMAFFYSALITACSGGILAYFVKPKDRVLAKKDGYFTVTMVWIVFSLFGSLPYIIGNTIPSFVDAFFETMSGFTTTGSSILDQVEALPHATLFWRSLTQWLGGLGIIMLFLAILPSLGIEGRDLYVAEVTGPTHSKTSFTFSASARRMWFLYVGLTLLQSILLYCGGMGIFDSVCHAFTSMATGGFSTKQASVGHWDSAYLQYVMIAFMFIAGCNFGLLYMAVKGNISKLLKDNEFQWYIGITVVSSLIIGIGLYVTGWAGMERSFRDALFQVVTLMTTTGYATADYLLWPPLLGFILLLLMFMGASAGSTAGGIKVVRVLLLFKNSFIELKRIIHPNGVINVKYNNKSVHPNIMTSIMGFFILYIIILTFSSLVMTLFTENVVTATSAVVTCISNVGPGFGSIGPMYSFSHLNDFAKIFLAFVMLIGRLELFTVMVLFTKAFWKK